MAKKAGEICNCNVCIRDFEASFNAERICELTELTSRKSVKLLLWVPQKEIAREGVCSTGTQTQECKEEFRPAKLLLVHGCVWWTTKLSLSLSLSLSFFFFFNVKNGLGQSVQKIPRPVKLDPIQPDQLGCIDFQGLVG